MADSKRPFAAGIAALALLSIAALSACSGGGGPARAVQDGTLATPLVTDARGRDVVVQAAWVTPAHLEGTAPKTTDGYPPERYVLIHLTLDTHSVDLSVYDLASLASLQGQSTADLAADGWLPLEEESSHHRDGLIAFPGKSNERWAATEGAATLTLKEIAGVPKREFTWTFPAGG